MAHVTADRVRDTSTTTGTGAFSVSGTAPTGYRTFSAVLSTSDTCWYAIQHQTAAEWEVGLGTYSSLNTITRTTVLASSNAGSAVNFSAGTKDIFITLAATKTVQQDNSGAVAIDANSSSNALRITQTGAGNALLVEDSANPDATPFVISGSGDVGIGTTSPDALLTVNTIASFGDGAAATPSIAHKGDLNTGFWFPAADTIAASTAGTERMRIDSAGNVGIGTTPTFPLHVLGEVRSQHPAVPRFSWRDTGGAADAKAWQMYANAGSINLSALNDAESAQVIALSIVGSGSNIAATYHNSDTHLFNNSAGTERMRIDSAGNLTAYSASTNIGTADTSAIVLNIGSGATGNRFALTDYVGDTTYSDYGLRVGRYNDGPNGTSIIDHRGTGALQLNVVEAGYMVFATSSTERMRIDSAGNVGIGTTAFGSGAVVVGIANATTVPSTNPSGGGVLYVESGALKYRGSSGTITTIASA